MSYWSERQLILQKALEESEAQLKKRLASYYKTEARSIDRKIASYYATYGHANVIEYRTLLQTLPADDADLLIKDCDEFAAKYPQYADLIDVRKSIYKLDRLEGLQQSVRLNALEAGVNLETELTRHLQTEAMRGLNSTAEAFGFGTNFYTNRADVVKSFVNVAWADNERFSTRIWTNANKLVNYMSTALAQGFARGDSYRKMSKAVTERFKSVSERDAYRLIYTEGTYVLNQAQLTVERDLFESYKFSTMQDDRVCDVCQALQGQTFRMSEAVSGVNFPPMHPYCRCSHVPVVFDRKAWIDDYVRKHLDGRDQAETIMGAID